MDASDEKLAEADSIAKAPILRTLGWLSTHVTHRETETNMPANMDVKRDLQTQELRLQESKVDSQQAFGHQDESNRLLRQQLHELQKRLEDKENKLIQANEIIRVLRNEVQTLQKQLELQSWKLQNVIGQRAQTCPCIKQSDELKTLLCHDPCMQATSITSDGHSDLHPSHADTDAERSSQRSRMDQERTAQNPQQRPPLTANRALRTADDPPTDLPVSISDGTVTSSQQVPLRVVMVNLKDCREMLGSNGVYKIPTEDDDHDDEGSCGYNQYDDDYDDDDGGSGEGDGDEGDSDYDPTNEGLSILKAQISHGEKTLNPQSLCESKTQRQRKPHECCECGDFFPSLSRLLVHQKIHRTGKTSERKTRQVKTHECSECGKSFPSPGQLSIHQRVHGKPKPLTDTHVETETTVEDSAPESPHRECDEMLEEPCGGALKKAQKTLECNECGRNYSTRSSLKLHKKLHTGKKPHVCTQCDKTFVIVGHLRVHFRKKHGQEMPYQCPYCPENFVTASLLRIHKVTHLKCIKCGKVFRSQFELARHMRAHVRRESCSQKSCQCDICGKFLSSLSNLQIHQNTHAGERPHICTQCGKAFAQLGNLQAHYMIHTQYRRFECSHCPKRFLTSAYLKLHVQRHTGEKLYSCTECGTNFSCSSALRSHQQTHSEEHPFLCLKCGYSCKHKTSERNVNPVRTSPLRSTT